MAVGSTKWPRKSAENGKAALVSGTKWHTNGRAEAKEKSPGMTDQAVRRENFQKALHNNVLKTGLAKKSLGFSRGKKKFRV